MIGKLDERAIEDSLNRLIERHESLRTGIIAVNGEGHQIIYPVTHLSLTVVELSQTFRTSNAKFLCAR